MAIGYKVVRLEAEKYISISTHTVSECEYSYRHITRRPPNGGALAVFTTLKDAVSFCTIFRDAKIFKVRYRKSRCKSLWTKYLFGKVFARSPLTRDYPKGTDFAESVILLEEETKL